MELLSSLLLHVQSAPVSSPGLAIQVRSTQKWTGKKEKKSPAQVTLSVFSASWMTHMVPELQT
jgi:hypothetical protein